MDQPGTSCAQELAESANVPDQFGRLFQHVALNLRGPAEQVSMHHEPAEDRARNS